MALIDIDFFSNSLKRKIRFKVFVPQNPQSTMLLLHGAGDNCEAWINYTNVIRYNKTNLLIFPSGDMSFYVNRKHGEQFTDFCAEIVTYCQAVFRLKTDKLFIAGNSMGGYGALHVAHKMRDQVTKIGLFSPALDTTKEFLTRFYDTMLYDNSTYYMKKLDDDLAKKIFIYCGDNDYLYPGCTHFSELNNLDLVVDHHAHTWDAWDEIIIKFLAYCDE